MDRFTLKQVASAVASNDAGNVDAAILAAIAGETPGWVENLEKLRRFIIGVDSGHPFRVFALKNRKLPFLNFSTLPGVTCPGVGACAEYCYSFKSWRYPAAFARQAQNTWLLQQGAAGYEVIRSALYTVLRARRFGGDGDVILRLYVDGDFSTLSDMEFWLNAILPKFPQVRAYGYSKSLKLFLEYAGKHGKFPDNYRLNLSSGHRYGPEIENAAAALSCVRGRFVSVDVPKKSTNREVVAAHGNLAFVCPGQCGACTSNGHACGLPAFKNIDIVIPLH